MCENKIGFTGGDLAGKVTELLFPTVLHCFAPTYPFITNTIKCEVAAASIPKRLGASQ